jgi:hypothetical protein
VRQHPGSGTGADDFAFTIDLRARFGANWLVP